jgi:GPH family glycoside/pentoside/hexuronide:cation symporter
MGKLGRKSAPPFRRRTNHVADRATRRWRRSARPAEHAFQVHLGHRRVWPFAIIIIIIIITYVVKERREFYEGAKPLPLGKALTTSLTSRSFQILVAQNFMSILVSSLVVGSVFYMADYLVPMPTMVLLACIFVPMLIGIPLTTVLRARLGVVGAQQLLLLTAGAGLLLIMVAPPPLIAACLALAGLGLAGPQTLTNVLFAEVIDEDEIRSGVRREGAFFGINALVTKPAQSIAIALAPFILALTHFVTRDQNGGQIFLNQLASALLGIRESSA